MGQQWKPRGYQKLADLMGSHKDVAIFRRFPALTMLILLKLQAELIDVELRLRKACQDDELTSNATAKLYSVNFHTLHHAGQCSSQFGLLMECQEKLQVYHAWLLQATSVAQLKAPGKLDLQFLQDWLEDEEGGAHFLQGDEQTTWNKTNLRDFVTLIDEEARGLNTRNPYAYLIDWYQRIWRGYRSVKHEEKATRTTVMNKLQHARTIYAKNPLVFNYAESKSGEIVSQLAVTVVVSVFSALTIPWLYHVNRIVERIGITIGLTALLGIILRVTTNATVKGIFGVTVALATVEMVFIWSTT